MRLDCKRLVADALRPAYPSVIAVPLRSDSSLINHDHSLCDEHSCIVNTTHYIGYALVRLKYCGPRWVKPAHASASLRRVRAKAA